MLWLVETSIPENRAGYQTSGIPTKRAGRLGSPESTPVGAAHDATGVGGRLRSGRRPRPDGRSVDPAMKGTRAVAGPSGAAVLSLEV